eukprot:GHVL01018893.1.p1 GENE.GHVL01018893.1~~GHVL01018893.1.p1  ORF type:complete len:674 (+),score=108.03 GHVL01018893.1:32-2053(+)
MDNNVDFLDTTDDVTPIFSTALQFGDFEDGTPLTFEKRAKKIKNKFFYRCKKIKSKIILEKILSYFPILLWLRKYNIKKNLLSDVLAGITVGAMLIPQGMSFSLLADLPPVYGLYSSLLGAMIYPIFGSSRELAVGPIAILSVLISEGISQITPPKINNIYNNLYLQYTITTSFYVGIIQTCLGIIGLGFIMNFLSNPVLSGFSSAVAITVAIGQMRHLFGFHVPSGPLHSSFISILNGFINNEFKWEPFIMGIISILFLYMFKLHKYLKKVPSQLLLIILGIGITYGARLDRHRIAIVGSIPAGFPGANIPILSAPSSISLLAVTISIISFAQSIAVSDIYAQKKRYTIDGNKELIGLGMSNLIGSFFYCFPITGGFGRTAVNASVGAKSQIASIISGLVIIIVLAWLTPLFFYLPNPVLAAVVIVSVLGLFDHKEMLRLFRIKIGDFCVLMSTFLLTLFLGIELGILLGFALSLTLVIHRTAFPHTAELGIITAVQGGQKLTSLGDGEEIGVPTNEWGKKVVYRDLKRKSAAMSVPNILIYRFSADIYFANCTWFKKQLSNLLLRRQDDNIHTLILDLCGVSDIDSSGYRMFESYISTLPLRILICNAKGRIRDQFVMSGLIDILSPEVFFPTVDDAVKFAMAPKIDEKEKEVSTTPHGTPLNLGVQSNIT